MNTIQGRIYAIPDIHGRFDLLNKLWNRLAVDIDGEMFLYQKDAIVFMGDYVDRGPQSREVLEMIKYLTETQQGSVFALKGNHEDMMLRACSEEGTYDDNYHWWMNGGTATCRSFPDNNPTVDILEWVDSLPLSLRLHHVDGKEFFFSHSPVPRENRRKPNLRGMPYTDEELFWSYPGGDEFGWAARLGEHTVGVCGHIHGLGQTNRDFQPRFYDHYIYCDSGCGCHPKAPLVAVEVVSRRVISAWPSQNTSQD